MIERNTRFLRVLIAVGIVKMKSFAARKFKDGFADFAAGFFNVSQFLIEVAGVQDNQNP